MSMGPSRQGERDRFACVKPRARERDRKATKNENETKQKRKNEKDCELNVSKKKNLMMMSKLKASGTINRSARWQINKDSFFYQPSCVDE